MLTVTSRSFRLQVSPARGPRRRAALVRRAGRHGQRQHHEQQVHRLRQRQQHHDDQRGRLRHLDVERRVPHHDVGRLHARLRAGRHTGTRTRRTSGSTFTHTFPAAGDFPYYCEVHGSMMQGTIVVQAGQALADRELHVQPTGTPIMGTPIHFTDASDGLADLLELELRRPGVRNEQRLHAQNPTHVFLSAGHLHTCHPASHQRVRLEHRHQVDHRSPRAAACPASSIPSSSA